MKKISLLILFLALISNFNAQCANASVDGGINPNVRMISAIEHKITRAEFLNSIFEICKMDISEADFNNIFTDINVNSKNYKEIVYAGKIRLAHGYPDKTFKSNLNIKNDEAIAIISNIIQKNYYNYDAISQYKDIKKVPEWAKYSYLKAHNAGFIKDSEYLNPEEELTAENYAFLINRVKEYISKNYKIVKLPNLNGKDLTFIRNEELNVTKEAPLNVVSIYEECIIVHAGNLIPVSFVADFNSKKSNIEDVVEFVAKEDLKTSEGTILYPEGTKFIGVVVKKQKSTWLDISNKALIEIKQIETTPDLSIDYSAKTYTKDGKIYLTKQDKRTVKEGKKISGGEFLVKYSNLVAPVVKYKNKANDSIYLLLTGDMVIKNTENVDINEPEL